MVKAVLRFLDADEGRRVGVFQQQQVGKQLQSAIGHLLGVEGILKAPVVEAEQQAPVGTLLGVNAVNSRNPVGNLGQYISEAVGMFPLHVLDDVAQVVAVAVQAALRAGQGQAAGGVRGKVA